MLLCLEFHRLWILVGYWSTIHFDGIVGMLEEVILVFCFSIYNRILHRHNLETNVVHFDGLILYSLLWFLTS